MMLLCLKSLQSRSNNKWKTFPEDSKGLQGFEIKDLLKWRLCLLAWRSSIFLCKIHLMQIYAFQIWFYFSGSIHTQFQSIFFNHSLFRKVNIPLPIASAQSQSLSINQSQNKENYRWKKKSCAVVSLFYKCTFSSVTKIEIKTPCITFKSQI